MTNEEIIDEMLHEASELKIREEVLDSMSKLMESNPKMDRIVAVKLSLDNVKLHAGLNYLK